MSENNSPNSENQEVNSSNIFDEFESDDSLMSEVEKIKDEQNKDVFFYLSMSGKIFQNLFILMFVFILCSLGYLYIQENEEVTNKGFLDPVCTFVVGDVPIPDGNSFCSSLAFTSKYYSERLEEVKSNYSTDIFSILITIFENENFLKTKEVSFLVNKSENKLNAIEIMERFDSLKLDYLGIEKRRIQCQNIIIDTKDYTLEMKCESYSKGYEGEIIGFSGNKTDSKIGGTSISVANSFLNFIEKNSKDFELINKQRIFNTVSALGEKNGYTVKTPFDIKLKIKF